MKTTHLVIGGAVVVGVGGVAYLLLRKAPLPDQGVKAGGGGGICQKIATAGTVAVAAYYGGAKGAQTAAKPGVASNIGSAICDIRAKIHEIAGKVVKEVGKDVKVGALAVAHTAVKAEKASVNLAKKADNFGTTIATLGLSHTSIGKKIGAASVAKQAGKVVHVLSSFF